MSSKTVKLLLVGIGGYGHFYIDGIEALADQVELVAIVDPFPAQALDWPTLQAQDIPCFDTLDAFLATGITVDLAVLASPISFHADQSCALMEAGVHVLCEKPIAATIPEVERMREVRDSTGKFLEIGYQWSFSEAVQNLKTDILSGHYGMAQCLSTHVAWPRTSAYYARNSWAGKIHNAQGAPVYDSPVANATAHFLHNMLFVLGETQQSSALPRKIRAECYRVNPIENYDTACLEVETEKGDRILFYTTHAADANDGPSFLYRFEGAEIRYEIGGDIVAYLADGSIKNYGNPEGTHMRKLDVCVAKVLDADGATTPICSIEAASSHTYCVNALQQIPVYTVDPAYLQVKEIKPGEQLTFIPNMGVHLREAFEQQKLFSEMNFPWATPMGAAVVVCPIHS
ncbi:Gfo/Idh/MocA family oxidoreductase [Coraliomargarita algicola]|uniref:Gfo/Idh/MocA family oxidoreductase n=1 Tax=Coraliomargarita algicola TaxID=3092156 RepID=A0ABZ0RMM9_9BACT|nr:Gfo/Idh/MocA family oxidoreductase [Coraliomargarita sp. J2-16]WPJ96172.1 Gfo/Idh/MocA family oxidoreductase [Coraliomargarita sp. J2-16]